MTVISLDDLQKEIGEELAKKIEAALKGDSVAAVTAGGKLVATLMGPQAVRDAVHLRVLQRLATDPDTIDKLKKRFESDDLVR